MRLLPGQQYHTRYVKLDATPVSSVARMVLHNARPNWRASRWRNMQRSQLLSQSCLFRSCSKLCVKTATPLYYTKSAVGPRSLPLHTAAVVLFERGLRSESTYPSSLSRMAFIKEAREEHDSNRVGAFHQQYFSVFPCCWFTSSSSLHQFCLDNGTEDNSSLLECALTLLRLHTHGLLANDCQTLLRLIVSEQRGDQFVLRSRS